jgi:hypothetical protein
MVLKQIRMSSGSFKPNLIFENLVDQNPIWLDVTIPVTCPMPSELMISILWGKWLICEKEVNNGLQFGEVFATLNCPLDVLLELVCLTEPHLSQEA